MVTSPLGIKAKVGSVVRTWRRRTLAFFDVAFAFAKRQRTLSKTENTNRSRLRQYRFPQKPYESHSGCFLCSKEVAQTTQKILKLTQLIVLPSHVAIKVVQMQNKDPKKN